MNDPEKVCVQCRHFYKPDSAKKIGHCTLDYFNPKVVIPPYRTDNYSCSKFEAKMPLESVEN